MPRLAIRLLGPFEVRLDGEPVTSFASNRVRALLAYLAVEAGQPHRREVLASLLWPEWPDRSARTNLRNALSQLRTAIRDRDAEPPFLSITRETIQFNQVSDHWVDVTALARLLSGDTEDEHRARRLEEAVGLHRGSFLEGFSLPDSAPFEDWCVVHRQRLHQALLSALRQLADYYERRSDYSLACDFARRQLEFEPWLEEAHQALMRLLALDGRRSAALAQYRTCCRILEHDLGLEPALETQALYEEIRAGAADRAEPIPPSLGPRHSLPVQATPFVGREQMLAEIGAWLRDPARRLLTLVGPGVSGKTRLAIEAAAAQLDAYDTASSSFRSGAWHPARVLRPPSPRLSVFPSTGRAIQRTSCSDISEARQCF